MAISDEIMLKVENVSKVYRLGEIGGTTLRDELQRLSAKIRKKDDPTKKIGAKKYNKGEKFKALNNVSFEVKKGERIGIIGHNGAGKSTLLKLISRVTGPTEGKIYLNGRVASMLEVGTGFHPELTGRENVYMNGAILGMTKKEIDSKIEDIIEFSEVRQFIDTPVKRYSSGMYVKLAFAVAAHLDSEIVIMDEVLAVGDMAFQDKCLKKMKELSEEDDRTILYVSHNMNTIRKLCNRVIVLNKGKIIYDGDVEKGISAYVGNRASLLAYDYSNNTHSFFKNSNVTILSSKIINKESPTFCIGEPINVEIQVNSNKEYKNSRLRIEVGSNFQKRVGSCLSNEFAILQGKHKYLFCFNNNFLVEGEYSFDFVLFESNDNGQHDSLDGVYPGMVVVITNNNPNKKNLTWMTEYWGSIRLPDINISLAEESN